MILSNISSINKKVLLRERKRHTTRRVESTHSVVLTGYPPHPDLAQWGGGLPYPSIPPSWPGWGVPYLGTPGRVPLPQQGTTLAGYPPAGYPLAGYYPPAGYPHPRQGSPPGCTWQGTPLSVCPMEFWVMLQSIMGYGYPPRCLPHGILGNVAKHYGIWVPPPPCGQTDGWMDRHMSKHYLPIVLCTQAVIINNYKVIVSWVILHNSKLYWVILNKIITYLFLALMTV